MKKQITLDLHGVKHADVEDKLIDFFFWQGFDYKGVNIMAKGMDKKKDTKGKPKKSIKEKKAAKKEKKSK